METKRKALGKGLEQLFNVDTFSIDEFEKNVVENASKSDIKNIKLDELRKKVIRMLTENDIEVIHELKQEYWDENLHCYISTVSCKTPSTYIY